MEPLLLLLPLPLVPVPLVPEPLMPVLDPLPVPPAVPPDEPLVDEPGLVAVLPLDIPLDGLPVAPLVVEPDPAVPDVPDPTPDVELRELLVSVAGRSRLHPLAASMTVAANTA